MMNAILVTLMATAIIGPLQAVVADTRSHVTVDQASHLLGAIDASPILKGQLNALAVTGTFRGFRVGSESQVATTGPFRAAVAQGFMIFTADFLEQQKDNHRFDVKNPDDIFPNN